MMCQEVHHWGVALDSSGEYSTAAGSRLQALAILSAGTPVPYARFELVTRNLIWLSFDRTLRRLRFGRR